AGEPARRFAAQLRVGEKAVGKGRGRERVTGIVGISAVEKHLPSDSPVQQAGVEVGQAEVRGQGFGDGALAGCGRAVDSDDHSRALVGLRAIENRIRVAYLTSR